MPKLLLFVPCLKVIGGDDGLMTVVSLLENVAITMSETAELEANAGAGVIWQAACVWYRTPEDAGKEYEQECEIELPNKSKLVIYKHDLAMSERIIKYKLDGGGVFPINSPGEHWLRMKYRERGSKKWIVAGEYPVMIVHNRV